MIGGGVLTFEGGDQPNGVYKVDLVLFSYCSSEPLLGDFFGDNGFLSSGSHSGFVLGVKGSRVEVSIWLATAWAG